MNIKTIFSHSIQQKRKEEEGEGEGERA